MSQLFEDFKKYLHEVNVYDHVTTLLYWDMRTDTPKLGQQDHIDALTEFSTKSFKMSTSPKLGEMLDALSKPEEYNALDETYQFIVHRMKLDFDRNKRIPADFYEAYVREQAESGNAWEAAKNASDFSIFAPHLKKMVEMTKEMTGYTDPGIETYDALLNQFEEGMDSATIDRLFDDLKKELIPLVDKNTAKPKPYVPALHSYADPDSQKKIQKLLLD